MERRSPEVSNITETHVEPVDQVAGRLFRAVATWAFAIVGHMSEARTDIEKLNDADLVATYRADKDKAVGREVMNRLLAKVELSDLTEEPLLRRDGTSFTGADDQPLRVVDYLEVAGQHGPAEEILLGFVAMPETAEKFMVTKEGMTSMVQLYVKPGGDGGAAA